MASHLPPELHEEHDRFMRQALIRYRGYSIKPVSFEFQPYFINGETVYYGYNLCSEDGGLNMSPGAVWYRSIESAKHAIDCIHEAGGHERDWRDNAWIQTFWKLMRASSGRLGKVLQDATVPES